MIPAAGFDGFARLVLWLERKEESTPGLAREGEDPISPRDRLLWWLSEKGSGSWAEFRKAYGWVTTDRDDSEPAWIAARELQALGHIEFAWKHDLSWSVAPPVLTLLPNSDGLGYLTGARTSSLVQALHGAEAFDFFPEAVLQNAQGPHGVFLLFGSPGVAEGLARHLGIEYTFSVAEVLARVLPQLADMLAQGGEAPFRIGFERELFGPETLFWDDVAETESDLSPACIGCGPGAARNIGS